MPRGRREARHRRWIQDLRSAAALGTPDALALAVQGLVEDPHFAANHAFPLGRVEGELLPGGEILAQGRAPLSFLEELARQPLAVFRALAALAWTLRYLHQGGEKARGWVERLARDKREEVRHGVRVALQRYGDQHPERFRELLTRWLEHRPPLSPRLQALALELVPQAFPEWSAAQGMRWLEHLPLREHPLVQKAWVRTVANWGAREGETVLHHLGRWLLTRPRRAPWVAQALARPWAARHPQQVLHLLEAMYHRWGKRRWLTQALQALERQGMLPMPYSQLLEQWTESTEPTTPPSS